MIWGLISIFESCTSHKHSYYTVTLVNYLGCHINPSRNLILFDTVHLWIIHVVPMWYSDISKDLLSLFIGKSFPDSTALLDFTCDLQRLMNAGSSGSFERTVYHKDIRRFRSINLNMKDWVTV